MLKSEFSRAIEIVQSGKDLNLYDWMQDGMERFDGYGLPEFQPVMATIHDMAKLIAYEARQINGELDHEWLNIIWHHRSRFNIVGEGSEECVQAAISAQKSSELLEQLTSP